MVRKEVSLDHFHMLHEDHTYATIKVMKRKRKNDMLTFLDAFTLSYDVNLCCVFCAIGTNHAYASPFYPLRSAALVPAGSYAVSHFDGLGRTAAIFLQIFSVLLLLARWSWNREFYILVLTELI